LINVIHIDDSGAYGRLAALFARLALPAESRRVLADIPGLAAQQPLQSRRRGAASANGTNGANDASIAGRPARGGIRYAMIAANFEPAPGDGLLQRLVSAAGARSRRVGVRNGAGGIGVGATGAIFSGRNDLIVDAASASADGRMPLLLFDPEPPSHGRGKASSVPAGAIVVRMSGVHHTNLLTPARAQEFLRAQLWDEDA
jgi:hypothetical protein